MRDAEIIRDAVPRYISIEMYRAFKVCESMYSKLI